jgi:transcriptional regulator with XRE-family HTH domain
MDKNTASPKRSIIDETYIGDIFSSNLRHRLYEMCLSQQALANQLGVSPSQVARWTNGRNIPTTRWYAEICSALQITPDYLLKDRFADTRQVI